MLKFLALLVAFIITVSPTEWFHNEVFYVINVKSIDNIQKVSDQLKILKDDGAKSLVYKLRFDALTCLIIDHENELNRNVIQKLIELSGNLDLKVVLDLILNCELNENSISHLNNAIEYWLLRDVDGFQLSNLKNPRGLMASPEIVYGVRKSLDNFVTHHGGDLKVLIVETEENIPEAMRYFGDELHNGSHVIISSETKYMSSKSAHNFIENAKEITFPRLGIFGWTFEGANEAMKSLILTFPGVIFIDESEAGISNKFKRKLKMLRSKTNFKDGNFKSFTSNQNIVGTLTTLKESGMIFTIANIGTDKEIVNLDEFFRLSKQFRVIASYSLGYIEG